MLLSSVIIVLREMLEASFIISLLLIYCRQNGISRQWIGAALASGLFGALVYSSSIAVISNWFDSVGQEVVNALLQFGIFLSLLALKVQRPNGRFIALALTLVVALAMTREGAEILIYFHGFADSPIYSTSILLGGAIGAGIGISFGTLFYYGLGSLPTRHVDVALLLLLPLIGGNMVNQSIVLLNQADWLPPGSALWDSSPWLAETSLIGQLLYALIGYEATPTLLQLLGYLIGFTLLWLLYFLRRKQNLPHKCATLS